MLPEKLNKIRTQIDALDDGLLQLLIKRANLALEIGELKKQANHPIMDSSREGDILNRLMEQEHLPLNNDGIKNIFTEIISACRAVQAPVRVAFLGPIGASNHAAVISHFGRQAVFKPFNKLPDAFKEVDKDLADYLVAPFETINEGIVGQTLDLIVSSKLKARAQFSQELSYCLMSKNDNISNIKKIASYPEAIKKSDAWIQRNLPGIEIIVTASTGAAAALAQEDESIAIIANPILSDFYNMLILATKIEEQENHKTTFIVLSKDNSPKTEKDSTLIWFAISNTSGSLYECLKPLAEFNINVTRLHSRPNPLKPLEGLFFLEINGHFENDNVQKALQSLSKLSSKCTVVGSYPFFENSLDNNNNENNIPQSEI